MNQYSTNRGLSIAIICLVIINLATLGYFWFNKEPHSRQAPGHQTPADFIIRETKMSEEQEQQYLELVKEHRASAEAIRREVREEKDAFFNLLKKGNVSDSMLYSAAQNASNKLVQLDTVTFRHFEKVRALCNPDQKVAFDRIINDALRQMSGPPPHDRPRPPHH